MTVGLFQITAVLLQEMFGMLLIQETHFQEVILQLLQVVSRNAVDIPQIQLSRASP